MYSFYLIKHFKESIYTKYIQDLLIWQIRPESSIKNYYRIDGYANNASGQIFIFIFLILFLFPNSPFQLNKNPVCDI